MQSALVIHLQLSVAFDTIAKSAGEHPVLVGIVLCLMLVSTVIHIVIFGGYLILGMSKYFRRQVAELLDMRALFGVESNYWRQIFDVLRVRAMSSAQIEIELKRRNIDAKKTTEIVTTLVETMLVQLRNEGIGVVAEPPDGKNGDYPRGAA